jgi:hypothetical protein
VTTPEVGDDGAQMPDPASPRSLLAAVRPAMTNSVVDAIQPLTRSLLGTQDWRGAFMPKAPDLAHTFPTPGYDLVARNHELLGIESIVEATNRTFTDLYMRAHPELGSGINPAEAYARAHPGIGDFGATQGFTAFTRATEALAGPDLFGGALNAVRDAVDAATRSAHQAALSGGAMTRWLDGMHNMFSAGAHRHLFDIAGLHLGFEALMSPFKDLQGPMGTLAGQTQHFARAPKWSQQITEVMAGWTTLSGLGHQLCGWALQRALMTRDMVLHNADPKAVRRAVIAFMRGVLGFTSRITDNVHDPRVEARIEAVVSALLDDSWLPAAGSAVVDYSPRAQLRKLTVVQHSKWRPLTSTRHRGLQTVSLEHPVLADTNPNNGSTTSYRENLPAKQSTPPPTPITHPVLKRLMDPLSAIDQEIVWTRFYDGARTWEEAAVACGRTPKDGERLRRNFLKLKNAERQRNSA